MRPPAILFTLVVNDIETAIDFYCSKLCLFRNIADTGPKSSGARFVLLRFNDAAFPFDIHLEVPSSAPERALVGKQAGNNFLLGFPVKDCDAFVQQLRNARVPLEGPVIELPYGKQASCLDPFGNRISFFEDFVFD